MQKLKNWTAKRAGGRITINAVDADTGKPVKVVGVDKIESTSEGPFATDKDGTEYALV
jgi:hypothetical protein